MASRPRPEVQGWGGREARGKQAARGPASARQVPAYMMLQFWAAWEGRETCERPCLALPSLLILAPSPPRPPVWGSDRRGRRQVGLPGTPGRAVGRLPLPRAAGEKAVLPSQAILSSP